MRFVTANAHVCQVLAEDIAKGSVRSTARIRNSRLGSRSVGGINGQLGAFFAGH